MRNIDKDALIEIEIFKNKSQAQNLIHGWDESWETNTSSRQLTGVVFSERDVDHFKSIVTKQDNKFGLERGVAFGLTKVSSSEWLIYVVRYIRSSDTLSIDEISLDPSDGTYSISEQIKTWTFDSEVLIDGIAIELQDQDLQIYDLNYNLKGSYSFDREWDKNIGGIYGDAFYVDSFFQYQLMKFGETSAKYEDYKLKWEINEGWDGHIEINQDQEDDIYWRSGSMINIYLKPFRRAGIGDDYHQDLSLAFSGVVSDADLQGFEQTNFKLELQGWKKRLENKKEICPLDDFDAKTLSYTKRNGEDILSDIYNHSFEVDSLTFNGSAMSDRALTIEGSLKEAEKYVLYEENQISIIEPINGGESVKVNLYDDQSGETRTIEVGGSEEEDLVQDSDFKQKIGLGNYLNQVKMEGSLQTEDYRWICRGNRYDRFVDQEVLFDAEENERIRGELSDISSLESLAEGKIDSMQLYWSGDITLQGNHHYLAGMSKQGQIDLTYSDKGIDNEIFTVESMTLTPTQTKFRITKEPRFERQKELDQLRRDLQPKNSEDLIKSLEFQTSELYVDQIITDFWSDTSSIKQVDVYDYWDNYLIKDAKFNSNIFRGYHWIDLKLKDSDIAREDETLYNLFNKDYEKGSPGDDPQDMRIYGGKIEISDKKPYFGSQSCLLETKNYGNSDEEPPSGEYLFQWRGKPYTGDSSLNEFKFDYWRQLNGGKTGRGNAHYFKLKYKGNTVMRVRFKSDSSDSLLVKINDGNEWSITPALEDWLEVKFYNIDWTNYECDLRIYNLEESTTILDMGDISFVNQEDHIDSFEIDFKAGTETTYIDYVYSYMEHHFNDMGVPIAGDNKNPNYISVMTTNSDPDFYDISLDSLLKQSIWILPSYWRIIWTDVRSNSILCPGNITPFLSNVDELSIYGSGGTEGTYEIDRYEYPTSRYNTRIWLKDEIKEVMTGGYIDTTLRSETDLTIAVQKDPTTSRSWDQNVIL